MVINIELAGTIGLGIIAGVYQGHCEAQLRKARPGIFASSIAFYISRAWKHCREGGHGSLREIVLCQRDAYVADLARQDALHNPPSGSPVTVKRFALPISLGL